MSGNAFAESTETVPGWEELKDSQGRRNRCQGSQKGQVLGNLEGPPRGEAWAFVLGASERALEDGQIPCDSLDTGFPVWGSRSRKARGCCRQNRRPWGRTTQDCSRDRIPGLAGTEEGTVRRTLPSSSAATSLPATLPHSCHAFLTKSIYLNLQFRYWS